MAGNQVRTVPSLRRQHLGEQVVERGSVQQRGSFRSFGRTSFQLADAVSPHWRITLGGAVPVVEVKSEGTQTGNTFIHKIPQ